MARTKGAVRKDKGADKTPEVPAEEVPGGAAVPEEPKPEVKVEEPKPEVKVEEPKVKKPYVKEGKAVTSRKGILGPGALVKAEYFGPSGDAVLAHLISSGRVELK